MCRQHILAERALIDYKEDEESSQVFISAIENNLRDENNIHSDYLIGSSLELRTQEDIPLNTLLMDVVQVMNSMRLGVTFCRNCDFDSELDDAYMRGGDEHMDYMQELIAKEERKYWTTNTTSICDYNVGEYPDLVNVDKDDGIISFQPNSHYSYIGNVPIGLILEAYVLFALRRQELREVSHPDRSGGI